MNFFKNAKEKAIFVAAQQVAKADAKAFSGMLAEHRCLRNAFWDFILDTSNIEKWQPGSINALISQTSPEGFAKIGTDQNLQKKLSKKYTKLCQAFPLLEATLQLYQQNGMTPYKQGGVISQTTSQSQSVSSSQKTKSYTRQPIPSIQIDVNNQSANYTVPGIIAAIIATACLFLLIKFLVTALLVLGIGLAASAIAHVIIEEKTSTRYRC